MKKCPFCAEEIQDAAIKCRFCGAMLSAGQVGLPADAGGGVLASTRTSGFAIASLALGICWVYWIGSILALVFGYKARKDIRRDPDHLSGEGMAKAGIVLGWVGVATLIIAVVVLVVVGLHRWTG